MVLNPVLKRVYSLLLCPAKRRGWLACTSLGPPSWRQERGLLSARTQAPLPMPRLIKDYREWCRCDIRQLCQHLWVHPLRAHDIAYHPGFLKETTNISYISDCLSSPFSFKIKCEINHPVSLFYFKHLCYGLYPQTLKASWHCTVCSHTPKLTMNWER